MKTILRVALIALGALLWTGASAVKLSAQTITWTAASNPHVVSGTYTIPAGQTLVMEAGVIVNMQANSTLQVDGQLFSNGTAANHIKITGAPSAQTTMDVRGTSDLKFTEIRTLIAPDSNGVLLFADCSFPSDAAGGGYIFNGSILQADGSRAAYLQFDRCTFQGGASLYLAYANVVLRNTTFTTGSFCSVYPGYLFVDGVSSDHSAFFGLAFGSDSDLFLNNISVTNAAREGLKLAGDTRNGSNVLIGPNVTLTGNEYPVNLTVAGLHAGSAIPSTGNRNNLIRASETAGNGGYWPKFSIPYYVDGSPLTVGNGLRILPGVTVKMAPFSYINDIGFGDGMRAFGTKEAPITFERADPAQSWYDLHSDRDEGGRMRHTIVSGNTDGVNGGAWRLENCVFQNNGIGTSGGALISGSQFHNNTIGVYLGESLNTAANPNSFVGNGTGVYYSTDARNCWWNSPSGPTTPSNPGGTGDSIDTPQTVFAPFRTSAPSYADAPPEVVLMRPSFQQDPGSKVTLRWTSTDDVGIASHKILFSEVGNWPGSFQTVATLPGNQFTYEWTVPNIGNTINGSDAFIKVVAVDTTGKESFDEAEIIIPTNAIAGEVQFNVTPGQTFGPGEMLASVYTTTGIDPYVAEVEYYFEDVRGETRKLTGRGRGGLPFLSTDTMRFVVAFGTTTNNRKYWYSPFFKMRPDSHLNDAPPTVSLTFPQAGNSFAPGSVIPISWTASDDEGLRGFDILASYNAGRTWQPIAQNLPGTARSFDWPTAPGIGYSAVRVMVIAKDLRFQNSSSTSGPFSTTSQTATPTPTPATTPTPTPGVTPTPGITPTPATTPTPTPGVTPTPGITPTPAATPTPTPGVTPTPAATPTPTPAGTPTPTPLPAAQAINLSTRVRVQTGENVGIGGFIITGTASKHVLIRAIGPSLTGFGVPDALANPALELHGPGEFLTMTNDNWRDTQEVAIQATGIAPSHDLESAIDVTLSPGAYTAVARGSNNTAGVALIEVYDLSQAVPAKLANISTRAFVSSGDDIVIAGFILGNHAGADRIVLRGIGPSLTSFGVSAALANPTLELRDNNGALLIANNDWQDNPAQAAELTASGLAPTNNLESGIAATLPPGSYTALLAGVNNGTGIGVVEVYDRGMP